MEEMSGARVAVLESRIDELSRRVSALEETTRDDAHRVEARLAEMSRELSKLATAIAALTVQVAADKSGKPGQDQASSAGSDSMSTRILAYMIPALLALIGALAGVKIASP